MPTSLRCLRLLRGHRKIDQREDRSTRRGSRVAQGRPPNTKLRCMSTSLLCVVIIFQLLLPSSCGSFVPSHREGYECPATHPDMLWDGVENVYTCRTPRVQYIHVSQVYKYFHSSLNTPPRVKFHITNHKIIF
jgi:hypothetical protein